ncbi:MAG: tyrosine-protein phosphatase [Bdellovibrionaceae bacterium]|nr:tyrosine-protein phosphatase [Pseudobdellovibrionaceae bacterium]
MIKFLFIAAVTFASTFASAHNIPNFQQVHKELFRGGRPSVQDLRDLKKMGIRTILNLENDNKAVAAETDVAKALNFNYISIPTATFFKPSDENVDRIQEILKNPNNYPIFIHCTHGRDRTGLMMGIYRVEADGWDPKLAYKEMVDLGFRKVLLALKGYYKDRTGMKFRSEEQIVRTAGIESPLVSGPSSESF